MMSFIGSLVFFVLGGLLCLTIVGLPLAVQHIFT